MWVQLKFQCSSFCWPTWSPLCACVCQGSARELDSFMQILGLPHPGSLSYSVVPYFPAVMMVLHSVFWFFKQAGLWIFPTVLATLHGTRLKDKNWGNLFSVISLLPSVHSPLTSVSFVHSPVASSGCFCLEIIVVTWAEGIYLVILETSNWFLKLSCIISE